MSLTEEGTEPDDLIPREQMLELMLDIELLEGVHKNKYQNHLASRPIMLRSVEEVFEKHLVTAEQYRSSLEYYASDPEEMMVMYDELLAKINTEAPQGTSPMAPAPKK